MDICSITDRKRDFIKNSGGDMISPARVEGALTLAPEIAQAMVFGDLRPYLVAVLVPDPGFAAALPRSMTTAVDLAALAEDPGFHKTLGDAVARINRGLAAPNGCGGSRSPPSRLSRKRAADADPEDQAACHPRSLSTAFETLYDG